MRVLQKSESLQGRLLSVLGERRFQAGEGVLKEVRRPGAFPGPDSPTSY